MSSGDQPWKSSNWMGGFPTRSLRAGWSMVPGQSFSWTSWRPWHLRFFGSKRRWDAIGIAENWPVRKWPRLGGGSFGHILIYLCSTWLKQVAQLPLDRSSPRCVVAGSQGRIELLTTVPPCGEIRSSSAGPLCGADASLHWHNLRHTMTGSTPNPTCLDLNKRRN